MQKEKKKRANNTRYLKTMAKNIPTSLKAYFKMSRFGGCFCQVAFGFCWFQGFLVCMVLRRWEEILQSKRDDIFLLYSLNVCFPKSAILFQALKSHSKMYRWDGYRHTLLTLPNPDYKCLASRGLFLAKFQHSGFIFLFSGSSQLSNFQLVMNKTFPTLKPTIKKTFIMSY